jgi:RimJ/RimL family protein N-acetyltransferase
MVAPSWPMETERLRLRPFAADDLRALHAIHSDEAIARWLYSEPRTLEETRELLVRKAAGAELRGEGEWLSAAVVASESGELVADVSLLWASEIHRQGELGFLVHPLHHGKGYATGAS